MSTGYIIATISILVGGYYQLNAINEEFDSSAKSTLLYKQGYIDTQIHNFKNYIFAIDETSEFQTFTKNNTHNSSDEKEHITSLMMAITRADPNIMQFRFIADNGAETIRIDRNSIGDKPYVVDQYLLQNKAQRYYFQETKSIAQGQVWFSNLDLNIEHGEIVKPIVPTLRVAKPYFSNGTFKGILIVNIFMKNILQNVITSELFHVSLIDKDSYILTCNDKEDTKEWTRYLQKNKGLKYTLSKEGNSFFIDLLFEKKYKTLELSHIIRNTEGLKIVLEEKTEKLIEHTESIIEYMLVMIIIVFIISFPIVAILSRYPLQLHDELKKYKDDLENQMDILDKYVYMTTTDLGGNITDVSNAFTELSGYTKDELIGQNHRILRDPTTPPRFYQEMWSTITKGNSWTGEIKNLNKSGDIFCIKAHIAPMIEDGKIVGFTSIRENITDQKRIEEISIRDELTQAYNRRFFNQTFPKELKRSKRNSGVFCIAMFDIDYFKKYNDTYGHLKGDEVLQKVVKQVNAKLKREGDYLFRVGGEEFIVIYPNMENVEKAKAFALKLVRAVEDLQIEHSESLSSDFLTISLGALSIKPSCSINENEILKRIDKLLYEAKESGRNRSIFAEC